MPNCTEVTQVSGFPFPSGVEGDAREWPLDTGRTSSGRGWIPAQADPRVSSSPRRRGSIPQWLEHSDILSLLLGVAHVVSGCQCAYGLLRFLGNVQPVDKVVQHLLVDGLPAG